MIEYSDATVFNVPARMLVNTVNCRGAMGAGIALEFKLRYPEMFADYAGRCRRDEVKPGAPYVYKAYGDPWILNFPTKLHWRDPSLIEWVEAGLERFASLCEAEGIISAAFPPLGCTNGGLEWDRVRPLMERYLGPLELKTTVCLDREESAGGVEARMVAMLNDPGRTVWADAMGHSPESADRVRSALPVRRFRDLLGAPGVSRDLYSDLFRLLYGKATAGDEAAEGETAAPSEKAVQLTFSF